MKAPRGTQDFLPPESERFAAIQRIGAEVFSAAGYGRIMTPAFEETGLFVRGVGDSTDIVNKEMYSFADRSGNELTLRPEGTASVMRAIVTNSMWDGGLPLKLFYDAAMFRYERPQKGRFRQHHQLGIEVVGTEDPAMDAEVIALGGQVLDGVGVGETTLLLNSMGHPGCREAYRPALMTFLEAHRDELDEDCRRRMQQNPLRVFDCKNEADQGTLADAPTLTDALCEDCRAHLDGVAAFLDQLGIKHTPAPRLVRGFDYYTRTVFEWVSVAASSEGQSGTLCGGGRYDGLVEQLGGPALPGIGFGMGIERLMLAQLTAGAAPEPPRLGAYVVPIDEGSRSAAFEALFAARARGVWADLATDGRSLKAAMKHANRLRARYAVLIGEKDRAAGVATVRDLDGGEQAEVALGDIAAWLEERTR